MLVDKLLHSLTCFRRCQRVCMQSESGHLFIVFRSLYFHFSQVRSISLYGDFLAWGHEHGLLGKVGKDENHRLRCSHLLLIGKAPPLHLDSVYAIQGSPLRVDIELCLIKVFELPFDTESAIAL